MSLYRRAWFYGPGRFSLYMLRAAWSDRSRLKQENRALHVENADLRSRLERTEMQRDTARGVNDSLRKVVRNCMDWQVEAQARLDRSFDPITGEPLRSRIALAEADAIRDVVEALRAEGAPDLPGGYWDAADFIEREFASTGEDNDGR